MGERHRGSNPVGLPEALQFDEFNECLPELGARVTRYKPSQVGDRPQARDSVPSDRLGLNCLRVEYFDLLALIELNPTDDIFRGAAGSTLGTTKIKAHALGLPAAIDIVTTKDLGGLEIELCEVVFPAAAEWMSIQFDMEQPNHLGEHHFRSELPARLAHFRADFVTCLKQWILALDSQLRKLEPTMFRFVGNEPKSFVELCLWCEERWRVAHEQPGHRDQFRREFVEYVEQLGAPLQASGFQIEGDEPLGSIRGRGKRLCMELAIQHREIPPTWRDAVWLLIKPVRTTSDLALWLLDRQQRLDEYWPASKQEVAGFRQKVLAGLVHLVKVWQPAHAPSDRSELLQQLLDVRRLCRSWHGESDEPARRTVCYAITEAHRFLADLRLPNRPQWPIEPTTLLEAEQQLEQMIAWLGTMTSETPPPAPNASGGAAEVDNEPPKPVERQPGTLAGDEGSNGKQSTEAEFVFRPDFDGYYIKAFGKEGHVTARGARGWHDLFRLVQTPGVPVLMLELEAGPGVEQLEGDRRTIQPVVSRAELRDIGKRVERLQSDIDSIDPTSPDSQMELRELETERDQLLAAVKKVRGRNGKIRDLNASDLNQMKSNISGRIKTVCKQLGDKFPDLAEHFHDMTGAVDSAFYEYTGIPGVKWDTDPKMVGRDPTK